MFALFLSSVNCFFKLKSPPWLSFNEYCILDPKDPVISKSEPVLDAVEDEADGEHGELQLGAGAGQYFVDQATGQYYFQSSTGGEEQEVNHHCL